MKLKVAYDYAVYNSRFWGTGQFFIELYYRCVITPHTLGVVPFPWFPTALPTYYYGSKVVFFATTPVELCTTEL